MEDIKKEVIMVSGGIGREIALTGVITEYAKNNPDKEINIIAGYPDLYMNNPYINRVYSMQHQYIFDDVIKNMKYIDLEPYNDYDYYNTEMHLIEVYNKLLTGKPDMVDPTMFLHEQEINKAKEFIDSFKKPVILFQPFGSMGGKFKKEQSKDKALECVWPIEETILLEDQTQRSLPFDMVDKLYNELKEDYDVILIRTPDQYTPKDAPSLLQPNGQPMPIRQVMAILPYVKGFISCDSFLHHAAKTAGLKNGIVFWGTTKLKNLGYEDFVNMEHSLNYAWLPNRQPHNNPDADKKNKDLMKNAWNNPETIEKVKEILKGWVDDSAK